MNKKTNEKNNSRRQAGFTLLFAALIASIVLSLGAAIFDIAIKQVALSSASRESQFAFYAADTASECALYWDARTDIYPNTFATSSTDTNHATTLTCDGQSAALTVSNTSPTTATTNFQFAPNGYCTQVTVTKTQTLGSGGVPIINTTVVANGYNETCANLSSNNTLQRTVQLNY